MAWKRGGGKKKINSVKVVIDGIKFQSRLEGYAYGELKKEGLFGKGKLEYEPHQFVIVDKFEYQGKKYQSVKITPDFVDMENKIIFEIKGMPNELFPLRWKLMKKHFHDKGEDWHIHIGMKNQKNVKAEIELIKELYVQGPNRNAPRELQTVKTKSARSRASKAKIKASKKS